MQSQSDDRSGFRVSPDAADLTRIAAVTGELAAAQSMEDIATVVASHVADAVRASVSTLMLREGDSLRMIGHRGVAEEKARRWSSVGIDDQNPASEAARTGEPVVVATAAEVAARYPRMASDTPASRSVVALPLHVATENVGAIGLTFERNWEPGRSELDLLMTFAGACAQTVTRIRATEAARAAAEQLHFLARASAELSSSLDYRATLSRVADLAVPGFADWCAVEVLADGTLATLAVAHRDPGRAEQASRRLRERYPVDPNALHGRGAVIRTGKAEFVERVEDEALVAFAKDDEHLTFLRELNLSSVVIAPLTARGKVLGTISLVRTEDSPPFTEADLAVAEDLGARAGVAMDNARLHEEVVQVATELRDAVMAQDVTPSTGWTSAAHHRADGRAGVGGDFFDSVILGDGRLAFFIGDVAGHGVKAAAAMAHMRAAIRVLLTIDPDPEAVVRTLDVTFDQLLLRRLVSLVYAILDADGTATVLNAGHCPPLVVGRDGSASFLAETTRPPIGAGRVGGHSASVRVAPGETILFYTDGLIERRREPIDVGLQRLAASASVLAQHDLAAALPELLDAVRGTEGEDDVALVAFRRE